MSGIPRFYAQLPQEIPPVTKFLTTNALIENWVIDFLTDTSFPPYRIIVPFELGQSAFSTPQTADRPNSCWKCIGKATEIQDLPPLAIASMVSQSSPVLYQQVSDISWTKEVVFFFPCSPLTKQSKLYVECHGTEINTFQVKHLPEPKHRPFPTQCFALVVDRKIQTLSYFDERRMKTFKFHRLPFQCPHDRFSSLIWSKICGFLSSYNLKVIDERLTLLNKHIPRTRILKQPVARLSTIPSFK